MTDCVTTQQQNFFEKNVNTTLLGCKTSCVYLPLLLLLFYIDGTNTKGAFALTLTAVGAAGAL